MYDDWSIQHGERVKRDNSPPTAELCAHHRPGYSERKTNNICTKIGCWSKGAPTAQEGVLECALHSEERLSQVPGQRSGSQSGRVSSRQPEKKYVEKQGFTRTLIVQKIVVAHPNRQHLVDGCRPNRCPRRRKL